MNPTANAIETDYDGHRFRSRLEARWAVVFNELGIRYEYEKDGVQVTGRLELDQTPRDYLPDFWFPELGLWGEVKGVLDEDQQWRVLNDAASLSSADDTGCHDSGGNDLVLLGPIPASAPASTLPVRLHMHKGSLLATAWDLGAEQGTSCTMPRLREGAFVVATDSGEYYVSDEGLELTYEYRTHHGTFPEDDLTRGLLGDRPALVEHAFKAARAARFEFGEKPPGRKSGGPTLHR